MPARGRNQEINEWNEECFAINFLMLCSFFFGLAATLFLLSARHNFNFHTFSCAPSRNPIPFALQQCLSFNLRRGKQVFSSASVKRTHHNSKVKREVLYFSLCKNDLLIEKCRIGAQGRRSKNSGA